MSQSLHVIALISGGKDSIYSILHCLQNGHKVVALGNVYPLPLNSNKPQKSYLKLEVEADEDNLNSYMYQTVGHTVVPLYEQALGIPLYRQPMTGKASAYEATYERPEGGIDETESLVPLFHRIIAAHPEANAVSTGAILSTYQRTRVESVALRLGLVPLSFLWQYPHVVPTSRISLLVDMAAVGLDARIIKTASWALNESFLWQNAASGEVMRKIEKAMARFGDEDGAALGEGGEFETLALDGPDNLFKGRIVVEEEDRQIIEGSSTTAWVRINRARVEMKTGNSKRHEVSVTIPNLFSANFQEVCQALDLLAVSGEVPEVEQQTIDKFSQLHSTRISLESTAEGQKWTMVGSMQPTSTIDEEVEDIMAQIKESLTRKDSDIRDVMSTFILLRSMSHFAIVNKIYGSLFIKPNPPARVTIACGDLLPPGYNIVVHLSVVKGERYEEKDLHVQSRSYWAPANIGPYSQARSEFIYQNTGTTRFVHVAGQIPLVPTTMALPVTETRPGAGIDMMVELVEPYLKLKSYQSTNFIKHAVLSLQHLWRIGQAMDVCWWTGVVAYLSKDSSSNIIRKAKLTVEAWSKMHGGMFQERSQSPRESEDERDPWEERYHKAFVHIEAAKEHVKKLPDWSVISPLHLRVGKYVHSKELPPIFVVEVEELPRGSDIEWHALLGVTRGPIVEMMSPYHKMGSAFKYIVVNKFSQTFVSIYYRENITDLANLIDEILSEMETEKEATLRKASPGYHHSHTAYLDATIADLWNAASYAGVIPCRSLWGVEVSSGKLERLAAVLVFQSFLERGDFEVDEMDPICKTCG